MRSLLKLRDGSVIMDLQSVMAVLAGSPRGTTSGRIASACGWYRKDGLDPGFGPTPRRGPDKERALRILRRLEGDGLVSSRSSRSGTRWLLVRAATLKTEALDGSPEPLLPSADGKTRLQRTQKPGT